MSELTDVLKHVRQGKNKLIGELKIEKQQSRDLLISIKKSTNY